jgi:uncharacterized protein YxeA
MKNVTAILAVMVMILVGLACSGDETEKANALVDEANKFITEGNKNVTEATDKGKQFDTMVNDADETKTEQDKITAFSKDQLIPVYDKMKDNFSKAGDKFSEASKLKVNDKFKEYLDLKSQEFKKRADYAEALKGIPKSLTDSKSKSDYNDLVKKVVEKADGILKEAKDLDDKATKIQTDNPSIFKKS